MLHIESRQTVQKDFHPIASLLFVGLLLLVGCGEGNQDERPLTLDDLSEWRNDMYALDTQQIAECLGHFSSASSNETAADRHVKKFYAENPRLLWITHRGLRQEADTLLAVLQREVPRIGFSEKAFFIPQIAEGVLRFHQFDFDTAHPASREAARLDFLLSKAYTRYAVGQRYGFTNPRMMNFMDVKTADSTGRVKQYNRLFDIPVDEADYDEPLRKLQKDSLNVYLAEALPKDAIYKKLQAGLLKATENDERTRLMLNMERRRWRTDRVEDKSKYIIVNVAAQHLWAVSPDSVLPMRICCGAVKTKSPLLTSAITHMEVNPAWGIPMSIIRNDVARHGGDSGYFARHRYTIYGPNGPVNPSNVSSSMLLSGRYHVSQKGGAGNSLGRIVFRFPNNFSVYLHDTSNRGAFQYANRALSHGCIRVQKPFELAHFLLPDADDWTLDKLRLSIDIKPETEDGRNYLKKHPDAERPLRLVNRENVSPHVPVAIDYYTVYPNPQTGELQTWPDGYGYDSSLKEAIKPFLP